MNQPKNEGNAAQPEYTPDERMAVKYLFIREKILFHFKRGRRILFICKIVATVLFLLFTLVGVIIARHNGHVGQWLQAWILVIFLNVIIFVIAEYAKYLVESKVIPYLQNDEQVEFGEYDIFLEDIDGETDDEEDEDEEE